MIKFSPVMKIVAVIGRMDAPSTEWLSHALKVAADDLFLFRLWQYNTAPGDAVDWKGLSSPSRRCSAVVKYEPTLFFCSQTIAVSSI